MSIMTLLRSKTGLVLEKMPAHWEITSSVNDGGMAGGGWY